LCGLHEGNDTARVDQLAGRVRKLQGHAGNNQAAAQKRKTLKDQLKKARQRVDWDRCAVEWVVFEDVLGEVQALERDHQTGQCSVRRANELWAADCFSLELYEVDGDRKTKAAAFVDWAKQGRDQAYCHLWWDQFASPKPKRLDVPPIQVDETWKRKRMQEMTTAQGSGQ
jgi:hypothetical protein